MTGPQRRRPNRSTPWVAGLPGKRAKRVWGMFDADPLDPTVEDEVDESGASAPAWNGPPAAVEAANPSGDPNAMPGSAFIMALGGTPGGASPPPATPTPSPASNLYGAASRTLGPGTPPPGPLQGGPPAAPVAGAHGPAAEAMRIMRSGGWFSPAQGQPQFGSSHPEPGGEAAGPAEEPS